MNSQTVSLGKAQIRVLSTVKGLVSEAAVVEEEIESFEPDLVALSIGPEEIEGTRKWDGEPYDMSGWDEVYGLSLRKLVGDDGVKLPPPSFSKAIKVSDSKKDTSVEDNYEFEPDEDEILSNLLPKNISTQIFKAMLENSASEQGSRMSAMDNATRNAGELVDKLTINYNRSRQAAITKELIEIISYKTSLLGAKIEFKINILKFYIKKLCIGSL